MSTNTRQQTQPPLIFRLHIEQRAADGGFPLHLNVLGYDALGVQQVWAAADIILRFPERLVSRAMALLEPQSRLQGGDEELLGAYLARQLMVIPVRKLLLASVIEARERDTNLQVALQIDAPELTTLPWEWLTIAGKTPWSPALLDDYGLVRIIDVPTRKPIQSRRPWTLFRRSTSPCVLLVAPSNRDAVLLALKRALRPLIQEGALRCEVLVAPTMRELGRAVSKKSPDVLHILARAEFDTVDTPRLFLDEALECEEIAAVLGSARPIVVLDGSWRVSGGLAAAANRMAHNLVAQALDGVVAFHSPLSAEESAIFARRFYSTLASGRPLYDAMIAGRQELANRSERAPWGLPILVQRAGLSTQTGASAPAAPRTQAWIGLLVLCALGLIIAFAVFGRNDIAQTASTAVAPSAAVVAPTENGVSSVFRIALPTPSLAVPIATPTIGMPPTPEGGVLPSEPTPIPAPLGPPARWTAYIVVAGDTVATVAERMGSDAAAIATLNRVDLDQPLVPGRGLMIPVYGAGEPGVDQLDVNRGRQDQPLIALTFDTEINDVMLYKICDILRARGLHATFFVTGNWVRAYPDAARTIVANGHELGNHSLTHPNFTAIGLDGAASEIDRTEAIIVQTTGVSSRPFFRFPYGAKNPKMLHLLNEKGYISYHWTADDTTIPKWLAATAPNPHSGYGAILLMHQRPTTIAALPGWLDQIAQMGLTPVPLSQILR